MRRVGSGWAAVVLVLAGTLGCSPVKVKPVPEAPAGVLQFHFTRKIEGPLELSLDGTRIPVELKGKKGFRQLLVTGIAPGKHRYFIASPREAFGPDLGEIEMAVDKGVRLDVFAQKFTAVLYGTPEPPPPAEGLPGVRAVLQK